MSLNFESKIVVPSLIAGKKIGYLLSHAERNSNTEVGANYTVNPDSSAKKKSTYSKFTLAFTQAVRFVLSRVKTKIPEHDLEKDLYGSTPLQKAPIHPAYAPIVKKLIDKGARRLGLTTNYGLSALRIASKRGDIDTVKILVDAGARIDQVAKDGKTTPIDIACRNYNFEIVEMLFNAGAKIKGGTLDKLDFEKDRETFKLFKNNANPNKGQIYIDYINQIKELGKDHLCSALKKDSDLGSFYSSKKLIEQNPYLVDISIDPYGRTPLMFVSEKLSKPGPKKHFEDMFEFLIANKADLNLVDHKGETALFKACKNGHADIVNKLLEHGAMSNEGSVNIEKLLSSASPEMISLIGKYLPKSSEPGPDPRPLQANLLYPRTDRTPS